MLYRYRPFAKGGVAELFQEHNIEISKLPLKERKSLVKRLEKKLTTEALGDFICTFGEVQLKFEGADEMGHLHHYLTHQCSAQNCQGKEVKKWHWLIPISSPKQSSNGRRFKPLWAATSRW